MLQASSNLVFSILDNAELVGVTGAVVVTCILPADARLCMAVQVSSSIAAAAGVLPEGRDGHLVGPGPRLAGQLGRRGWHFSMCKLTV